MKVQQSTTAYGIPFFMADSSDHITGKTGLSPTVTISKNAGSFASPSGAITEIANGWYKLAGDATDSNTLGGLAVHATASGADPSDSLHEVVVDDLTTVALRPTTAGRTLDVASTGEAGLDVANISALPVGALPALGIVENGTMQAGSTSTTAVLRSATNFGANNIPNAMTIWIVSGTGAGQSRPIDSYVNSTDTATVSPAWTTTPDNTSVYIIYPTPPGSTGSPAPVNTTQFAGQAITAAAPVTIPAVIANNALLPTALDTDGSMKASVRSFLGTAITETAGQIAAAFTKFFNKATPTGTINSIPDAVPDAAGGLPVTGTRLTAIPTLPAALATDGSVKSSVQSILGTAFTEGAAGRIAAAFKQFFNIATPAATMDHGILVDTTTTLTTTPSDSTGVTSLLTRVPAALVGGRMSSDIGSIQAATALGTKYGSLTLLEIFKVLVGAAAGVSAGASSGAGTATLKTPDGTSTLLTATYDANGNVTAITFSAIP